MPRHFVHPYNFVRLPDDLTEAVKQLPLFAHAAPASHDRQSGSQLTGYLDCVLTTHADWFIPHPEKLSLHGEHKTLGYFTLDKVDSAAWQCDPQADQTKPAIPGSSLRGMIRSVYEAATLSCLSVFDPGRLDFRVGYGPDGKALRREVDCVPCRVTACLDDGSIRVQFLDGRFRSDPEKQTLNDPTPITLPVALLHAYEGRVFQDDTAGSPSEVWRPLDPAPFLDFPGVPSGHPVAMAIDTESTVHKKSKRYAFRAVASVRPIRPPAGDSPTDADLKQFDDFPTLQPGQHLAFGYLQRTGPNIERKHYERVFFRAEASYNDPHSSLTTPERLAAFLADIGPQHVVPRPVVEQTIAMLQGYADRLGKRVGKLKPAPRALEAEPEPPYPSDFVCAQVRDVQIAEGQLYYALVAGDSRTEDCQVNGLYPVAIPRLSHEATRGDLLPDDFFPCARCRECSAQKSSTCEVCRERHTQLCPACRLFGWTRDLSDAVDDERSDAQRVDSWAGHVRFSHGQLINWPSGSTKTATEVVLPILGSPKPTFTEFYLRPVEDWKSKKQTRWPPAIRTHESPLYRRAEARLRGRKLYRRREHTRTDLPYPQRGGLRRPGEGDEPTRDSQNQTVFALPAGMNFGFRVYFDNVSREELGALVFALTLAVPESWPRPAKPLRHQLGHGKPLGMGSCEVVIQRLRLNDPTATDHPGHPYRQTPNFGELPNVARPASVAERNSAASLAQEALSSFEASWQQAIAAQPALNETRRDLLEMLTPLPADAPVHYPPRWAWPLPEEDEFYDVYTWFVANRRGQRGDPKHHQPARTPRHVLLPDPTEERTDESKRLPVDPTADPE